MTCIFKRKGRRGYTLKFQTAAGRWRMLSFRSRALAEQKALDLRERPDSGRPIPVLADYATTWLHRRKPFLRTGPFANYEQAFRLHLLPRFGTLTLDQIDRGAVKDLLAEKLTSGLSRSTVTRIRLALKWVMEDAVEDGLIHQNPAAVRMRFAGGKQTNVKAFTQAQLILALESCRARVPERFVLVHLLAMTGLRLGEALALKWEDIDWTGRTVRVCRGWTHSRIEQTKTGQERAVDLAGVILDDLRAWDASTKARAMADGDERPEWIFPSNRTDEPMAHSTVSRDFKVALRAAGLATHYTPHSLRHTYASLLLSAGESPYYVQRQLGHATMTMTTGLYGRWLPAGNPEAVDRLAGRLSPRLSLSVTIGTPTTARK